MNKEVEGALKYLTMIGESRQVKLITKAFSDMKEENKRKTKTISELNDTLEITVIAEMIDLIKNGKPIPPTRKELQAKLNDMEEERKDRDETEQSLSKWIVELQTEIKEATNIQADSYKWINELQAKLDKYKKFINTIEIHEKKNYYVMNEDLYYELLKEE